MKYLSRQAVEWNLPSYLLHAVVGLMLAGSVLISGGCTDPSHGETAVSHESSEVATAEVARQAREASTQGEPYVEYGDSIPDVEGGVVSVERLLEEPERYIGQTIRAGGQVQKVCQKAGCWIEIGGSGQSQGLFIKFTCPIEGRLIPMAAVGKRAEVMGELRIIEISEARARHYAEDDGRSPEEIAAIIGPQQMVTMASPSARVFGLVSDGEGIQ